ncbi:MAG: EAL domain-containing protein [Methylococcaceae bacterium]|nr:EAL domain-containing protein [Methylococcaceae bacterium]MDD1608171.1 EAL domain-containing protein [Methylococcaceae bacterium]MDD1610349.1 EAL domain-containing protein [Methylococcaceae bacterium]
MIKCIANLPISRKLLLIAVFPSVLSLLVVSIFILVLEISEFQKYTQDDLSAIATIIANRSTAALIYNDKKVAQENLTAISTLPEIQVACLYKKDDKLVFAEFLREHSTWTCPLSIEDHVTHFTNTHLYVVQPIMVDTEQAGTVYIHANFTAAYWHKIQFIGLLSLVLLSVSIVAFLLSTPLLRLISAPISKLVAAAEAISASHDYSLRAVKSNDDELGVLVDAFNALITTVEKQSLEVIQAKNRYITLYDDNPSMMFSINALGNILSVNQTCAQQLGLTIEELKQHSIFDFIYTIDIPTMSAFLERCLLNPMQVHKQEFRQIGCHGQIDWLRVTAKSLDHEHHANNLLLVCEDITEARDLSEKIAYQACHDTLTGLANRSEFDRYVKKAMELVYADNSEHVLCYLDLDQFKVINDTCGHLAGDELLRQLGDVLKKNMRGQDFIARLGGDEFGVLMYYCSLTEAVLLCENLRDVIRDFRFSWEGKNFSLGVSIGVSAINKASRSAVNLLKEADSACYAAKDKGRNRIHVYSPDDEELALRHGEMQWVEKIRRGIENNSFLLYGQPIVSISQHGEEEGLHFETLIRYLDDAGRIVPPSAFLPAAERYGLAPELDRWVIRSMFEFIATTPDFLDKLSLCSVNLSGLSFCDETMLGFIFEQFDLWKVPTHKICFEITETAAIANLSSTIKFITALRERGCLFSLDDFGSGLSSFGYLKNLPVDYLKIDGLFVKDILEDKVDLAMVKSINEVGHVMGKKTIAEFVENEAIFNLLNALGVDYAQGYGIGKPVLLTELKLIKPFMALSK